MRRSWNEATWGERAFFAVAYLLLSAWAVVALFPLSWMVTTALKPPAIVMRPPSMVFFSVCVTKALCLRDKGPSATDVPPEIIEKSEK